MANNFIFPTDINLQSLTLGLIYPGQVEHVSFDQTSSQVLDSGGGVWQGNFVIDEFEYDDEKAGKLRGFLSSMAGKINTFTLSVPSFGFTPPAGEPRLVSVSRNTIDGSLRIEAIDTASTPTQYANDTAKIGMRFSMGGKLFEIINTATANVAGNIAFICQPGNDFDFTIRNQSATPAVAGDRLYFAGAGATIRCKLMGEVPAPVITGYTWQALTINFREAI